MTINSASPTKIGFTIPYSEGRLGHHVVWFDYPEFIRMMAKDAPVEIGPLITTSIDHCFADAIGTRVFELPITPERVVAAIARVKS